MFFSAKSHTIDLFFFFFLDKALKMLGNSDGLSHKTVQILHTHFCWCPARALRNNAIFSLCLAAGKKYFKESCSLSEKGVTEGVHSESGHCQVVSRSQGGAVVSTSEESAGSSFYSAWAL